MRPQTLTQTVTNILLKRVTDEQAKEFALNHYGVLCTFIRAEQIKKLTSNKQ